MVCSRLIVVISLLTIVISLLTIVVRFVVFIVIVNCLIVTMMAKKKIKVYSVVSKSPCVKGIVISTGEYGLCVTKKLMIQII